MLLVKRTGSCYLRSSARSVVVATVVCLALGFADPAHAIDEYAVDMDLAARLTGNEWYDWAVRQLDMMLARYPDGRDEINIEKARALHFSGKRNDADKLLKAIAANSSVYLKSRLAIAELAYTSGKLEDASKAYAQYFAQRKEPASRRSRDVEEFSRAVQYYVHILQKEGKSNEAAKVIALLKNIQGEAATDDRQMTFMQAQVALQGEEEKFPKVNEKTVTDALKKLETLQYQVDGVAAYAFVEMARAYVLLQKNEKAIETVEMSAEMLQQIDEALRKEGGADNSPVAGAFFYWGQAAKGLARDAAAAKKTADAKAYLAEAIKRFYVITSRYEGSPYYSESLVQFDKCKGLLERFGASVESEDSESELKAKMEKADAYFAEEKFKQAGDLYLEGIQRARKSRKVPEAAVRLIVCYGKLGKFREAEAMSSYLEDVFPDSEETVDSIMKLGVLIYQHGQGLKDDNEKQRFLDWGMRVWDRFVNRAELHPKAPEIAFMIAENSYKKAADTAKAAAKTTDAAERRELQLKARELYEQAMPKYERVIDKFGAFEKGVRSLYKLGWICYSTERPQDAAHYFLTYSESETQPKYSDDRLEAKFRAAEQLMLNGEAIEAINHFSDLIEWTKPGNEKGFDVGSATVKRIAEDSASYLGWAFDLAAEEVRSKELREFTDRIKAEEARISASEATIVDASRRDAQATSLIDAAKQEFADLEAMLSRAGSAIDVKVEVEEEPDMSEEMRQVAKRNAEDKAKRFAAEKAKQERDRLAGEKLSYQSRDDDARKALVAARADLDAAERALAKTARERKDLQFRRDLVGRTEKSLGAKIKEAQDAFSAAEALIQKCNDILDAAKERKESRDAAVRGRAAAEVGAAARELAKAQLGFQKAQELFQQDASEDNLNKHQELLTQVAEMDRELADLAAESVRLAQRKKLLGKAIEKHGAERLAVAKALKFNEKMQEHLVSREALTEKGKSDTEKLRNELLDAFSEFVDKVTEEGVLVQTMAREEMARARQVVEKAGKAIEAVKKQMGPTEERLQAFKRKAQEQFGVFLKAYPKSKHAPDNMSRLGSIFLELGDNTQAAKWLDKLAAEHPDSSATKDALFNLGRAQFENGEPKRAAGTFGKLVAGSTDQPSPNISYISDTMLVAGFPMVSLAASEIILARSKDQSREDYATLRDRVLDRTLLRAGQASAQLGKHEDTITYLEKLLDHNPRTGHFFDVKFQLAESKGALQTPDFLGAIDDLGEILRFADSSAVKNRALCMVAETYAGMGGAGNLGLAAARCMLVVELADASVTENIPWIQKAYYEGAKAFARLGKADERDRLVKQYLEAYPDGTYAKQIRELPAAGT